MMDTYVVCRPNLTLGYLGISPSVGTKIEIDWDAKKAFISGEEYIDLRDLKILIASAEKYPSKACLCREDDFVTPVERPLPESIKKLDKMRDMEVIRDDSDLRDYIDISDTRVSQNAVKERDEARQAIKDRDRTGKMVVSHTEGESIQERLARLEGKNDEKSMAERVALKSKLPSKMMVISDDGSCGGDQFSSGRNAGLPMMSREEVEASDAETAGVDKARKAEQEAVVPVTATVAPVAAPAVADQPDGLLAAVEAMTALVGTLGTVCASLEGVVARVEKLEKPVVDKPVAKKTAAKKAAPKRPRGRPAGSKNKPKKS